MKITFFTAILLTIIASAIAAEPVRFIPATPDNTTFIDGTAFASRKSEWKWLPTEGNQGIIESAGDPANDTPTLIIHANGLEAGRDYEVFGFFWAHGFGTAPAGRGNQPHHWPARFGTGIAMLSTFGGRKSEDIPWIITPESRMGARAGYTTVLEEKNPLVKDGPGWMKAMDDTRLIRARLGISRADQNGIIPVYADDFPHSKFTGLTRIDGIGVRLLPSGEHDGVGRGKPGYLHLAVRSGDALNMRRELAAGANVNALDEDGVTPLLYPATFGDQVAVRELLKAGANPNQPGQTIAPLTGAASWGDTEMVKLLLDAGAEVPDQLTERSPLLDEALDPARLHPAIAAIRAGSLSCLKLILGKNPELDLTKLAPEIDPNKRPNTWRKPEDMVPDAIALMHDDLAAFLVTKGCKADHHLILATCMGFGDRMAKTREALLARGVPAVQPIPFNGYSGEYLNEVHVKPWDGLSAAISLGDLTLTHRFLALARNVDERYLIALYAVTDTCGNPEVRKAVQSRFPNRPQVAPSQRNGNQAAENDEAARLFLPRIAAKKADAKDTDGTWNLAVVAAPDAAGPASLVEVRAANGNQWQVLDRSLIEAAIRENNLGKPWEKGEHRLADLGDKLTADVILVVTKLAGSDIKLIRFEAVDVISGLVIHREYAEEKSMGTGKPEDALLAGINTAMTRARSNNRPLALSLLTFTAGQEVPSSKSLARLLRSSIEIEVDGTPGLLAVGMNDLNTIAQEQNLRGEGSFWSAACTLEGGIAALADGRVSVTLRLRNLTGSAEKPTDVMVEGRPQDIPALASRAWKQMIETAALPMQSGPQKKPDAKQTALEAARLAREAEWLVLCRRPKEAKPLAERAAMLGADPQTIVPIVLACLFDALPYRAAPPLRTYGFEYYVPLEHVPSLACQRALIDSLDAIAELLEKSESLYQQHGNSSFQWSKNPTIFLTVVQTLCYTRSVIPVHLLSPEQKENFDAFCAGLDRFAPKYMADLTKAFRDRAPNDYSLRIQNTGFSTRMLEHNPQLPESLAKLILARLETGGVRLEHLIQRCYDENAVRIGSIEKMTPHIAKSMEALPIEPRRALELQLQINRCKGDEMPLLLRSCQLEKLASPRHSYQTKSFSVLAAVDDMHYGLRGYFRIWQEGLPSRKNMILHSLFHEPAARPECIVRSGYLSPDRWSFQSTFDIMESSSNPKMTRNSRRNESIQWAKSKLSVALGNEALVKQTTGRVEALADIDLMYGLDVFEPVFAEWTKLTGKTAKDKAIKPALLTNLLSGPEPTPGIFDFYTPDTSKAGRIWLRYRPFENGLSRTNAQYADGKTAERGAWLFAIDGKTGQIESKVGLSTFDDLKQKPDQLVTRMQSLIAQNSSTLLTHVGWNLHDINADWRGGYALIDKSTGKTISLINNITIKCFDAYPRHQDACVEVIGDEYYMLATRSAHYDDPKKFELIRMNAKGHITSLTKPGRKPELTPFDAEDRPPEAMVKQNESLLIYDERRERVARYDTKQQTWNPLGDDHRKNYGDILTAMQKAYLDITRESREIRMPDGKNLLTIKGDGGMWPGQRVFLPSLLAISLPNRKNIEVPLQFDFPDAYKKKARFIDEGFMKSSKMLPDTISTVEQLQAQKRLHPIVVCQTEEALIIALRIKPLESIGFDETGAFLPFLWTLPKSTLYQELGIPFSQ